MVLTDSLFGVHSIDEAISVTTSPMMMACPSWVLESDEAKPLHLDPVMLGVVHEPHALCHCVDVLSLHLKSFEPFIQVGVALHSSIQPAPLFMLLDPRRGELGVFGRGILRGHYIMGALVL